MNSRTTFFSIAGVCCVLITIIAVARMAGWNFTFVHAPPAEETSNPPAANAAMASASVNLQQLVAPIALYPDPLLADVLAASTYPDQIVAASQFIQVNSAPPQGAIDAQPWDASVKSLVHYPSVVQYMAGDMPWTQSLGSAFASEPSAVMAAVQQLRAQAMAQGNLASSSQAIVDQEGSNIYLEPTDPNTIYVPSYDCVEVYSEPSTVVYGYGYPAGAWLAWGTDWSSDYIFIGDWHDGWQHDGNRWHYDPQIARAESRQRWTHDIRSGAPPRVTAEHYAPPNAFRGREFRPAAPGHPGPIDQRVNAPAPQRNQPSQDRPGDRNDQPHR